jgi:hypothetical protein
MRGTRHLAALALVLALGVGARGDDADSLEKPAREGLLALSRALFLTAAQKGAPAAADLAGNELPADMKKAFEAVAASPRAQDVRDADDISLRKSFLRKLVEETPDAKAVERHLVEESAVKLANELDDLGRRASAAAKDATQLATMVKEQRVLSVSAVNAGKAGPLGPLLVRLSRAHPYVTAELKRANSFPALYRALERTYERAPDAGVEALLALLPAVLARGAEPLAAVSTGDLQRLVEGVEKRLREANDATVATLRTTREAIVAVRELELAEVAKGTRSADLTEGVKLLTAFRKTFGGASPNLFATEVKGVYVDRNDNRVYFYLEADDRWVKGGEHATPPRAVVDFLLGAADAKLVERATDVRAVAALYGLFGDALPFESGMAGFSKTLQALAARVRALEAIAVKGGATREVFDSFLAAQVGYDRELAGPTPGADDAAGAARGCERLARTAIESGEAAATAMRRGVEASAASLDSISVVSFSGIKLVTPALRPGSEVTLRFVPGKLALPPLVGPAATVPPGVSAGCVIALGPSDVAEGAAIEASAVGELGEPLTGTFELNVTAARAGGGSIEGGTLELERKPLLVLAGPRGARLHAGERLTAELRPHKPVRLRLKGPDERLEPAPWSGDGGVIAATPAWPAGRWIAQAQDASGIVAQAGFEVEAVPGVLLLDAAGQPVVGVKPGTTVEARFLSGGVELPAGNATIVIEYQGGGVAQVLKVAGPRASLVIPPNLPLGRYLVRGKYGEQLLASTPLAVSRDEPRLELVRDPFGLSPAGSVGAGEKLYVRLEPGFAVRPDDVIESLLQLRPRAGAAISARAVVAPGFPASRLIFPVTIPAGAAAGPWEAEANVTLAGGRLRALASFTVAPGADLAFSLHATDGDVSIARAVMARGERALVRADGEAPLASMSFVLSGPDGLASPLEADRRGDVALVISGDAPLGRYELRGIARTPEGGVLRTAAAFTVYTPPRFAVTAKGRAGEQAAVDIPVPAGFVEPLRVRVGRGSFVEGAKAVVIPLDPETPRVPLVLEDANGRRAVGEATLEIVAVEAKTPGATPRGNGPAFAVIANVKEKTVFCSSFESTARLVKEKSVPDGWVVVNAGPLGAAEARDWIFANAPYDGPREPSGTPASVYRTRRIWKNLAPAALAAMKAQGCPEDTVFDVTSTPSPGGEEPLEALVQRALEAKGGWTYSLESVRLRVSGGVPDPGPPLRDKDLQIQSVSFGFVEVQGISRVVAPGALADLSFRASLPPSLAIGEPFTFTASTAAVTTMLVPDRTYPGGLEKLASRALLAVFLEGSIDVEGKVLKIDAPPSLDQGSAGRELVFTLTPTRTERHDETAGKPRFAESYLLQGAPSPRKAELDVRLEPVPPGVLANKPRRLLVHFLAHLGVAVTPGDWPADRPRPEPLSVGGASFLVDPIDLPPVAIEVEATYVRYAPEGAPLGAPVAPALKDILVGPAEPSELAPLDAKAELAAAAAATGENKLDAAEAHARLAAIADPASGDAWMALGEAVSARGRSDDAVAILGRAAELAPRSGRALVGLAEALSAVGRGKEARAAAKRASEIEGLDADLRERAKKVLGG